jgi:hypothetical protein
MKRLNAVWHQCRRRKMPGVRGHQDFRVALDCSCENVAVAVVGKVDRAATTDHSAAWAVWAWFYSMKLG